MKEYILLFGLLLVVGAVFALGIAQNEAEDYVYEHEFCAELEPEHYRIVTEGNTQYLVYVVDP